MNTENQYSQNVKDLCTKTAIGLSKSKPEIVQPLLLETQFLDIISPSFTTRKYCVENNIHSIPICECCGNISNVNKKDHKLGFNRFCSDDCRKSAPKLSGEVLSKLSDKEWLYHERIILQKSKETIAEELGISVTPINKWLKFNNIPERQYNKSGQNILQYIDDKDWLYQKYVIENLTCEQIAKEIGSSKSTISIKLNEFGIEISAPNSYDRPFTHISKGHQEIIDFIISLGFDPKINDRKTLNGIELDIYLPDEKLAIEYGSVYTHHFRPNETSFSLRKDEKYHVYKSNECEKLGISLFHIWEHDWKHKKELLQSMIVHKLGLTSEKIYARKCVIKEVPIFEKNLFLEQNHIQGKDKSLYKIGLYYEDELVSLMTISTSRYNKKFDWEITRFCSKKNTVVVGAFSKLLKHFRKNYLGNIITYADRFHSDGNVYESNGMKLLYISPISYRYAKKNTEILLHRQNFQKKKLKEMGLIDDENENVTEREIMLDNGYVIVYDCGHKCYGI